MKTGNKKKEDESGKENNRTGKKKIIIEEQKRKMTEMKIEELKKMKMTKKNEKRK